MCECVFSPYKDEPQEESWHFLRKCEYCENEWYGTHCPHDGYQNPCLSCGRKPTVRKSE
jgi:hypothetical protein